MPSYNSCYAEEDTQTLQNLGLYKMEEKLEGLVVHRQEEEEEEELWEPKTQGEFLEQRAPHNSSSFLSSTETETTYYYFMQ